ncbi:testis-expressed protein 22 isoform X3 [Suricata suricatta]|uniref:testis-expressed protein 22 isoform X3 n=1 Tax=Suricata suricatta TaxID=37032 RepID=UPI0011560060|nr:testis-expressed protein 22 isoform X3 [Suricata suricatta]
MDSLKHLADASLEKKPGLPLSPESPPTAWGQPCACSGGPQVLQTQDWDIPKLVAQLVSEDVDKDVLLPRPPRSSESANAFHAFLARSAPFWQTVTLKAQASRSPPS